MTPMLVGYARTSTVEQVAGFEAPIRDVISIRCEKLFREQLTFINSNRPELERAIEFVREGGVFVVTRLDRLACSVGDLNQIVSRFKRKRVGLKIMDMPIDTTTPTGRLLMNRMGSLAQFERELMFERQREGIAKAKAEGKFKGRFPTARRKTDSVLSLHRTGNKPTEIAAN